LLTGINLSQTNNEMSIFDRTWRTVWNFSERLYPLSP